MSDALEKTIEVVCENNNVSDDPTIQLNVGNGACRYHAGSGTDEASHLLSTQQVTENNGEQHNVDVGDTENDSSTEISKCRRELQSLKTELNEVVVWKLKLWMVILLIFLVITLVIGISVIVCEVTDDDGDDNYDKSSFVVEHFFRGNFTLDNSSTSLSLDQETLLGQLEQKLTGFYSSSHALERYFSNAAINHLQDTTAQFKIKFMMPLEHEELVRFTLSLEVVKKVLVQHLHDQDTGDPLYIIPTSLNMEVG